MRFKIFFGNYGLRDSVTADEEANKWLAEHPFIDIVDIRYQQARMGVHSICIAYEEKENEDH